MNPWNVIATVSGCVAAIAAIVAVIVALFVQYKNELPEVIVFLEYDADSGGLYAVARNVGNGVARDVVISDFDERLAGEDFRKYIGKSFIGRGIPTLVPGAERRTAINAGSVDNDSPDSCTVKVTYNERPFWPWRNEKKVETTFELDIYSMVHNLHSKSDMYQMRFEIEKMRKALDRAAQGIDDIATTLDRDAVKDS